MKTLYNFFYKQFTLVGLLCFMGLVSAQTGGALYQKGPDMARAKIYPMAAVLDNGKVMGFGGREYNFVSCSYADVYDPVTNTFTEVPMNFPHDAAAIVKLSNGSFFLIGGSEDLGVAPGYSSTEIYDQATGAFDTKASMTMARMQVGATQLASGDLLAVGGWYNPAGASSAEIYNFTANTFIATTGSLNVPRANAIVLPTQDGGAVIAGGWPTYGGTTYTSVEYYNPSSQSFSLVSNQLIPADSGWMLNPIYTRAMKDNQMSNGKYLLLAYRQLTSLEYALIEFDPVTKTFAKINTQAALLDSYTDGGFIDLVLNKAQNTVYLMGVKANADPQQLCLVTVNLGTGQVYHPGSTFTMPADEYFYPAMTFIPSNGKILVQGINASNASYFYGTNKTYILTPQTVGIQDGDILGNSLKVYPNPAAGSFQVELKLATPSDISLRIIDKMGRVVGSKSERANQEGVFMTEMDISTIPTGVYSVEVQHGEHLYHQNIVVCR